MSALATLEDVRQVYRDLKDLLFLFKEVNEVTKHLGTRLIVLEAALRAHGIALPEAGDGK